MEQPASLVQLSHSPPSHSYSPSSHNLTPCYDRLTSRPSLPHIQPDEDIRLSGKVTYVGTSSLETTVVLEQLEAGRWEPVTRAEMVMVARDPLNTGAAVVNPLVADTPEEQQMLKDGAGELLLVLGVVV